MAAMTFEVIPYCLTRYISSLSLLVCACMCVRICVMYARVGLHVYASMSARNLPWLSSISSLVLSLLFFLARLSMILREIMCVDITVYIALAFTWTSLTNCEPALKMLLPL